MSPMVVLGTSESTVPLRRFKIPMLREGSVREIPRVVLRSHHVIGLTFRRRL